MYLKTFTTTLAAASLAMLATAAASPPTVTASPPGAATVPATAGPSPAAIPAAVGEPGAPMLAGAPSLTWTGSGGTIGGTSNGPGRGQCETFYYQQDGRDVLGIEEVWFRTTTYFCWNWLQVTYHSTYSRGVVTGPGAAAGWQYSGESSSFTCYQVAGYRSSCGGNYETAQGQFEACVFKIGCVADFTPFIQEWENGVLGRWSAR
jgi:hypothetical protein